VKVYRDNYFRNCQQVEGRRRLTSLKIDNINLPLLRHRISAQTAFSPEALVEAVRKERALEITSVPSVCVLDFDGDLTDWLVGKGIACLYPTWAYFHTTMYSFEVDGVGCGIIARTIGGPYAVLVAEQPLVCGGRILLGLLSAGRIDPSLPVPNLVVATSAITNIKVASVEGFAVCERIMVDVGANQETVVVATVGTPGGTRVDTATNAGDRYSCRQRTRVQPPPDHNH